MMIKESSRCLGQRRRPSRLYKRKTLVAVLLLWVHTRWTPRSCQHLALAGFGSSVVGGPAFSIAKHNTPKYTLLPFWLHIRHHAVWHAAVRLDG